MIGYPPKMLAMRISRNAFATTQTKHDPEHADNGTCILLSSRHSGERLHKRIRCCEPTFKLGSSAGMCDKYNKEDAKNRHQTSSRDSRQNPYPHRIVQRLASRPEIMLRAVGSLPPRSERLLVAIVLLQSFSSLSSAHAPHIPE